MDLGSSRDKLFVSGHSAGGHMTARIMATDCPSIDAGLPVDLVKIGIPISGLYELKPLARDDSLFFEECMQLIKD